MQAAPSLINLEPVVRNSGATLIPCLYKTGGLAVAEQGRKMRAHPAVFVPVIDVGHRGYCMLMTRAARDSDVPQALERLTWLWTQPRLESARAECLTRAAYHAELVLPLAKFVPPIYEALTRWWPRAYAAPTQAAYAIHGDATLENVVEDGLWIDPSTRAVPLEAEVDGGKLLQSYFGYGEGRAPARLAAVRTFILAQPLSLDLCAYHLLAHLARLYRLQPQAQSWAVALAESLEQRMEEFKCRLLS